MKNKFIFTISTFVLCSYFTNPITTAEASKHSISSHKTSHHSSSEKHHSKQARFSKHGKHTLVAHRTRSHSLVSNSNSREGIASLYSSRLHGRKTASGERYDMFAMTAAHKTLPLLSYVEITNLENNKSVVVRINDRGPFHSRRIVDLSYAAARELGIHNTGTGNVKITPLAMN